MHRFVLDDTGTRTLSMDANCFVSIVSVAVAWLCSINLVGAYNVTTSLQSGDYPSLTLYLIDVAGDISSVPSCSSSNSTNCNRTYSIESDCLNFYLISIPENGVGRFNNWQRPSYSLYIDDKLATLRHQTHTYQRSSFQFWASVYYTQSYICYYNFTNTTTTTTNNNNLTIAFEGFPDNVTLEIYKDGTLCYENSFDDTATATTSTELIVTSAVNNNYKNINLLDNTISQSQKLTFNNIKDGCYDIIFNDYYFDAIDSSLIHTKYVIYYNDKIIKYGGYYAESESYTFCTNDKFYLQCMIPFQCENIPFDRTYQESIVGNSYKSFYNSTFTYDEDPRYYFYGSYSFENGIVDYVTNDRLDGTWTCQALFACKNSKLNKVNVINPMTIRCQAYRSCENLYQLYWIYHDFGFDFHWCVM